MALDEKALERMLKAQKDALERAKPTPSQAPPAPADRTDLFEEFVRDTEPGEAPKPKGLNAAGYKFPPEPPGGPAMTKANMAKGIGLPKPVPPSKEPAPPTELVQKDTLFEEYQRPGLKEQPRTGKGLRGEPAAPKTAKEILSGYQPPEPQVFTPRRTPPPASAAPQGQDQESDAAHLDAEADLAAARGATMSTPRNHGPQKTVTDADPLHEMPPLPGRAAPAPATLASPRAAPTTPASPVPPPAPAAPHGTDAPALRPGAGPRIAVVQSDFNFDLTTRMAQDAAAYAHQLGASVVHHLHVAGAFDIPLTAKALAMRDDVDAVVAIGCIIQGETGHDQIIARECARKLSDLAYESGKPVGLAVTGPRMTKAQAEARIAVARHAVAAVTQQWRGLQALGAAQRLAR
jgi:6,7-dimethyl-8-ribityllumazine synthase